MFSPYLLWKLCNSPILFPLNYSWRVFRILWGHHGIKIREIWWGFLMLLLIRLWWSCLFGGWLRCRLWSCYLFWSVVGEGWVLGGVWWWWIEGFLEWLGSCSWLTRKWVLSLPLFEESTTCWSSNHCFKPSILEKVASNYDLINSETWRLLGI